MAFEQPGKYKATLSDYGYVDGEKPYVECWFDVEGHGSIKKRLYLTQLALERSLKNLLTLGLKGPLSVLADGPIGGALDMGTPVEIVVELKPGHKDKAKKFPEVAFINPIAGAKFDRAAAQAGKAKLAALEGNLLKLKTERGITSQPPSSDVGF